jgi:iron complex outermembrane receptor protein
MNETNVHWIASAFSVLTMASVVQAEEASTDAAGLTEIVVTARKFSESAQSVPLSIVAATGADLEDHSVRTLSDVQALVPNLVLQQHPSEPQSLSFAMRGQKQLDLTLTLDPSVGLYVDGFYNPRSIGLRGAMIDISRLEVLRGPQGTLYGRNTTGGAISLYTNDPSDSYEGSVLASAGNYGQWNVEGVANFPFNADVALRIVAQHNESDGYGKDGLGARLAGEDNSYYRGKLRARFGDRLEAIASMSYLDTFSSGSIIQPRGFAPGLSSPAVLQTALQMGLASSIPQLTPQNLATAKQALESYVGGVGGNPYRTAGTDPSWSTVKVWTAGLDLKIALGEHLDLRALSGYQNLKRANNGDFDGTPYTLVGSFRSTDSDYYSQELQLLGGTDEFNWVVGAYYGRESGNEVTVSPAIPLVNRASPTTYDTDATNESSAAFVQGIWEFIPRWRVTAGLRYSEDQRELVARNHNALIPCLVPAPGFDTTGQPGVPGNGPAQCPRTWNDKFSDPSWLISLDHEFETGVLGYAKVARGYRSGGRNLRGLNTLVSFSTFNPENVTEYEVGLKSEWFSRSLRLNFSYYYDDYTDIQRNATVATPTGAPSTRTVNAAEATVQGFEAEAVWRATDHLTLSLAVGRLDAKYDKFVDLTGDRTNEPWGLPEWSGNAGVRYVYPLEIGEFAAQFDYDYQGEFVIDGQVPSVAQLTEPSRGLVNGRISIALDSWNAEVAVFGRNLTDKEYYVSGSSSERSIGYNYALLGEPRQYGVEFRKRFGGG